MLTMIKYNQSIQQKYMHMVQMKKQNKEKKLNVTI